MAQTDSMGHYLQQPGDAVAQMNCTQMMRQSQDVLLASAADVAVKLVQRQYHLERLQVPASTSGSSKPVKCLLLLTLHLHTNVAQITSKLYG